MIELINTLNGSRVISQKIAKTDMEDLDNVIERAALQLKARNPEEVAKIATLVNEFGAFLIMQYFESESEFYNDTKENLRDKFLEQIMKDADDTEEEDNEEDEKNKGEVKEEPASLDSSEKTVDNQPILPVTSI